MLLNYLHLKTYIGSHHTKMRGYFEKRLGISQENPT